MIKSIFLLFLIQFHISNQSFGQSLENFSGLKSEGNIPESFLKKSSQKMKEDFDGNKNEDLDKDFFINTRFVIDNLLLSGQILFNEPVSNYVNQVAEYVLMPEPDLYDDLEFYVLKSEVVNAFSTDQGIIFITTGLLSQLENEAQLAFIICHEVIHYTEHHVQEKYVERQEIVKGKNSYRGLSYKDKVDELSIYSKDIELEADAKGMSLYLKSEYDIEEIFSAFGVLLYSYLPFDDLIYEPTYLNTKHMVIPNSFYADSINEITKEENYDDKGSSHPNIKTRIDQAYNKIEDVESNGSLKYIISEEKFKEVRILSRFENLNNKLIERKYTEVLYDIYCLEKKHPNNKYLKFSKLKALYGLMKYKNAGQYRHVRTKLKKVEGESYVLHAFMKDISKAQLTTITFRYAYDLVKSYPNDKIISEYFEDVKNELAIRSEIKLDLYKKISFDQKLNDSSIVNIDINDSIKKIDESDLSKYKKIKLKKKLRSLNNQYGDDSDENFHYFALYDIVDSTELMAELYDISNANKNSEEKVEEYIKLNNQETHYLGLDSIVVVEPNVSFYNFSNNVPNRVVSEKKQLEVNEMYTKTYSNLDLDIEFVNSKGLELSDVKKYNEFGLLNEWVYELSKHEEVDMISSIHDKIVSLDYNSDYYLFSNIDLYKTTKQFSGTHFYGIIFVVTAPFVFYDLMPKQNIDYTCLLYDAKNDKLVYYDNIKMKNAASKRNLSFLIYHVLYNINSKKKS